MFGPDKGLLWRLFHRFFRIGLFTIGGGYAMVPVIEYEVVHRSRWMSVKEFEQALLLAQSCPGPIAINASVLIGRRLAGRVGAAVGVIATALPSFLVMVLFAAFVGGIAQYRVVSGVFSAVRGVVVALITLAAWRLVERNRDLFTVVSALVFLAALVFLRLNPFMIVAGGLVAGLARTAVQR